LDFVAIMKQTPSPGLGLLASGLIHALVLIWTVAILFRNYSDRWWLIPLVASVVVFLGVTWILLGFLIDWIMEDDK